ncbi:MAG: YeeE/YedE thiosulfate transporter family protein [Thermovirga sp.]
MVNTDRKPMNAYLGGALAGIVSIGSVVLAGKYFGASTTFVRAAGFLERLFSPERVAQMPYFIKEVPKLDWQGMFLVGIFLGAFASALLSGTFKFQSVPDTWREHFGSNWMKRAGVAFVGGAIAMFGARLADGCPSGHGLSGTLQLAVSGYVALALFFGVGIGVARTLYGGDAR